MARIPLRDRDGTVVAHALVDDQDVAQLSAHRWALGNHGYAFRTVGHGTRKRMVLLHRCLLGLAEGDPRQVDHLNRDRLNNRRTNLRLVSVAAQRQNRGSLPGSSSRFRGVSFCKQTGKWRAKAKLGGRSIHLGRYTSEEQAGAVAAEFRKTHMPYSAEAAIAPASVDA